MIQLEIDSVGKDGWIALSPLSGNLSGIPKTASGQSGVQFAEQPGGVILHVAAYKGAAQRVSEALSTLLGCAITLQPRATFTSSATVLWNGPGQWLVNFPETDRLHRIQSLRHSIGAHGSIVDQSDGRAFFQITGDRVHDVLAKLIGIDLHPESFSMGACALTPVGHVPALFWRGPDRGTESVFALAVPRSYAHSVVEYVQSAGAEFNIETTFATP